MVRTVFRWHCGISTKWKAPIVFNFIIYIEWQEAKSLSVFCLGPPRLNLCTHCLSVTNIAHHCIARDNLCPWASRGSLVHPHFADRSVLTPTSHVDMCSDLWRSTDLFLLSHWCWVPGEILEITVSWRHFFSSLLLPRVERWLMLWWGRSSISQNGFCGCLESSEDPRKQSRESVPLRAGRR